MTTCVLRLLVSSRLSVERTRQVYGAIVGHHGVLGVLPLEPVGIGANAIPVVVDQMALPAIGPAIAARVHALGLRCVPGVSPVPRGDQ